MTIRTLEALFDAFRDLGATHTFCKRLAENDNSKQQIYLGGSLDALNMLPFGEVASDASAKRPNMKAPLKLLWLDEAGRTAPAPGAQLILYPDYPEVRLSGFLRGCARAPAAFLQPVPRERRKFDNAPDGRILFLANHPDRHLIAFLAPAGSAIAEEFENQAMRWRPRQRGVFLDIPLQGNDARSALLARLREIHAAGWHASRRLNAQRVAQPYIARNGAGYTLEALFGIVPNSKAQPDFLGWELKACGSDRITLMTPEPDSGFYGKHGAEEFVRKFGHQAGGDTLSISPACTGLVNCAGRPARPWPFGALISPPERSLMSAVACISLHRMVQRVPVGPSAGCLNTGAASTQPLPMFPMRRKRQAHAIAI